MACDRLQLSFAKVEIPWVAKLDLQKDRAEWAAINILQEVNDLRNFDIEKYIDLIVCTENPNNEDIEKVKEYYAICRNLYKGKKRFSIKDGCGSYQSVGVDPEMVTKIKSKAEEYVLNKELVKTISGLYNKMLKGFDDIIK